MADDASAVPTARTALAALVDEQHVDAVVGPSSSEVAAATHARPPRVTTWCMCSGSNSAGALSDVDSRWVLLPDRAARPAPGARAVTPRGGRGPEAPAPWCIAPTDCLRRRLRPRHGGRRCAGPRRSRGWCRVASGADPTTVVTRALAGNPDAVVLVGFPDGDGADPARRSSAADQGPTQFPVYGSDGLQTADLGALVDPANPAVVAGLTGTTPRARRPASTTRSTPACSAAGVEPFFSASAYDCAILIGLAAVAAQLRRCRRDPHALRTRTCAAGSTATTFVECSRCCRPGARIHYRGAFSAYETWRGTEPGTGVYDVWTMGLDAHPIARRRPPGQIAVP